MTATPEPRMVFVSAPSPPTTTTAGKGPVPLGSCTLAEKLALLPLADALTVMLVRDTVPVTLAITVTAPAIASAVATPSAVTAERILARFELTIMRGAPSGHHGSRFLKF